MCQVLASSRFPVPNVLTPYLGDYGLLVINTAGRWHVYDSRLWHSGTGDGLTTRELWAQFKVRPPTNVMDGWAGIMPVGLHQQNYNRNDLLIAFKQFMERNAHKYQAPSGTCFDPLKKARMLKRISNEKVPHMIQPAPVQV